MRKRLAHPRSLLKLLLPEIPRSRPCPPHLSMMLLLTSSCQRLLNACRHLVSSPAQSTDEERLPLFYPPSRQARRSPAAHKIVRDHDKTTTAFKRQIETCEATRGESFLTCNIFDNARRNGPPFSMRYSLNLIIITRQPTYPYNSA